MRPVGPRSPTAARERVVWGRLTPWGVLGRQAATGSASRATKAGQSSPEK